MKTVTMGGNPLTILGNQIQVGDVAPDVTLCRGDFSEFKLSEYFGKKIILTVFPSIDTSVCALQTKHFNKTASELDNTVVITVSKDLPPALGRFCAAEGIDNIITASDYKFNHFGEEYGYLIDELKFLARGSVFIDTDGIVKYVEYVEELTHEPNYNALLEVLNA